MLVCGNAARLGASSRASLGHAVAPTGVLQVWGLSPPPPVPLLPAWELWRDRSHSDLGRTVLDPESFWQPLGMGICSLMPWLCSPVFGAPGQSWHWENTIFSGMKAGSWLANGNVLVLLAVTSQLLQPGIGEGVPVPGRGVGSLRVPSNPKTMILGLILLLGQGKFPRRGKRRVGRNEVEVEGKG